MAPAPAPGGAPRSAEPVAADAKRGGDQVDRDALASLERRIAALAANVTEVAAEVARLQAVDTPATPEPAAEAVSGDADRVQVSIEELDSEQPDENAGTVPTAEAADPGSQPAPVIRLVPIADEEDEQSTAAAAPADAAPAGDASAPAGDASAPDPFRNDVRDVLGYLDQLLDELPPERVREFAQSPQFATYKSLFKELGLDD